MAQTVYIGLAVSGDDSVSDATFDNVSVTFGATPFVSSVTPIVGTIGTPVTITGSNFGSSQGTSTISFNGVAATSVASWSSFTNYRDSARWDAERNGTGHGHREFDFESKHCERGIHGH